jgi:hypothetical protein
LLKLDRRIGGSSQIVQKKAQVEEDELFEKDAPSKKRIKFKVSASFIYAFALQISLITF